MQETAARSSSITLARASTMGLKAFYNLYLCLLLVVVATNYYGYDYFCIEFS